MVMLNLFLGRWLPGYLGDGMGDVSKTSYTDYTIQKKELSESKAKVKGIVGVIDTVPQVA